MAKGRSNRNGERANQRGSILLVTLMIVTVVMAVALGTASINFYNLRSSLGYADAQVARDAAEAGAAYFWQRLNQGGVPEQIILLNLDTNQVIDVNTKKPPYERFVKIEDKGDSTTVQVTGYYGGVERSWLISYRQLKAPDYPQPRPYAVTSMVEVTGS